MARSLVFGILFLCLCSLSLTQTTEKQIDGCAKNCAFCVKNRLSPYHKSCTSCVNSSPKPTAEDKLYLECSGSPLANCQINTLNKDGKLICDKCLDGYLKMGEDKCEKLSSEYENCRSGITIQCQECISNHIRTAGQRKCEHVKAENVVYGCDNYLNFAKRITCDQCSPGLVPVNGQCLIDPVQEQCENGTAQQQEEKG